MVWSYGLVQEGEKIILCEIYYDFKNKPMGYCYVELKEIKDKETIILVSSDIQMQLEHEGNIYTTKDFMKHDNNIKNHMKRSKK
jgi:hypothetical protein